MNANSSFFQSIADSGVLQLVFALFCISVAALALVHFFRFRHMRATGRLEAVEVPRETRLQTAQQSSAMPIPVSPAADEASWVPPFNGAGHDLSAHADRPYLWI